MGGDVGKTDPRVADRECDLGFIRKQLVKPEHQIPLGISVAKTCPPAGGKVGVCGIGVTVAVSNASHHHDPAARLPQVGQQLANHIIRRSEVDLKNIIQTRVASDTGDAVRPRIVDQQIELLSAEDAGCRLHRRKIGEIDSHRLHLRIRDCVSELLRKSKAFFGVAVQQNQLCAQLRKEAAEGSSQSTGGSGHGNRFAVQRTDIFRQKALNFHDRLA